MLSVATGHSASYLTGQVGAGMEAYYTGTAGAGEPPGVWWGKGAQTLGLDGEVVDEVMHGLYGQYLDPRDPLFADPDTRNESAVLGRKAKQYRTPERVVEDRIREYGRHFASTPTPEQIQAWRIEAERGVSAAAPYYDLTFSPDKSVTVMHTAFVRAGHEARAAGDLDRAQRFERAAQHVEEAMMAAATAGLEYVQDHAAFTRVGRHGGRSATGRWQDVNGLTVAQFLQHTSRDLDPQLHVHQAVLNKVESADGKWRALDGTVVHAARPAAAAISERELENQLAARLGVRFVMREDGIGRRVDGVDHELESLFSGRRQAITKVAEQRLAAFEERVGRPASNLERDRIMRASTLATRRAKTHTGESEVEQYDRWAAEAAQVLAGGLGRQATVFETLWQQQGIDPLAPGTPAAGEEWTMSSGALFSPEAVIAQALEACHGEDGRATFSRYDLIRQIDLALPDNLGPLPPGEASALLQHLADLALAREDAVQVAGLEVGTAPTTDRLANGSSNAINPASVQYATRGHLAAEFAVLRTAGVRGATALDGLQLAEWLAGPGASLSPAQREALAGLATSDAALAVLVGPAGTGKSYTAGMLDAAWRDLSAGGRVVAVTTTQVAADVLADDGVADTANVAAFLTAQARLDGGRPLEGDHRWRLGPRDVLLVDEASMVDTGSLTRLHRVATASGARVVLMGDPRQLGAVGAGGMMRAAIDRGAETYTLSEVRRFTAEWERDASLRLRAGDASAIEDYDRHGRLVDGGREAQALTAVARAAAADRIAGWDVLVVTGTNEHASKVSAAIQRHLIDAGLVSEAVAVLGRDGTSAGVGDLVQGRRIDRTLGLVNREVYRVVGVQDDGTLDVVSTRTGEPRVMPPAYVEKDVTLAYATTAHGAEGRTVDIGHLLLDNHVDPAGAYVGASRGRESNTVWAVTSTGDPEQQPTTARGLLARILTDAPTASGDVDLPAVERDAAAVDVAASDELRREHAATLLGLIEDETRLACRQRLEADLDTLVAEGVLSEDLRARMGAEQGTEHLSRLLRAHELAGHDPAAVLREALADRRSLEDALAVSQVIAYRIDAGRGLPAPLDGRGRDVTRIGDDRAGYLSELHALVDEREQRLGLDVAGTQPQWAVAALGAVPEDHADRAEWTARAGRIAAVREATGWTDERVALGRCPGVHTPEKRAAWHAAYTAAGMPEERRPEAEMTDGRLLTRVRAAERARDALPSAVHEAQRDRHLQAEAAAREAVLARAAGRVEDADRLEAEAAAHAADAERLDAIADTRARALVAYAETLTAGETAREELIARGKAPGAEPDRTTAAEYLEWLAAEREAREADDAHRVITEADVDDHVTDDDRAAADRAASEAELEKDRASTAEDADGSTVSPSASGAAADVADVDEPRRPAETLSATAGAAEIAAAALHAATVAERLADQASQTASDESAEDGTSSNAAVDDTADDEWHRTRGRDEATAIDHADDTGLASAAGTGTSADDGWDDAAGLS